MFPLYRGVERISNGRREAPLLLALHKIWREAPRSHSQIQGARLRSTPGGEGFHSLGVTLSDTLVQDNSFFKAKKVSL